MSAKTTAEFKDGRPHRLFRRDDAVVLCSTSAPFRTAAARLPPYENSSCFHSIVRPKSAPASCAVFSRPRESYDWT